MVNKMRVTLIGLTLLVAFGCAPSAPVTQGDVAENRSQDSAAPPLVPLITNFWSYWDHYWTTWLPDHPVYEMIEVTVYEGENEGAPFIRVLLSEREGDSAQIFYLNDVDAVERSQANTRYADIEYQRSGEPGKPQNLEIRFFDEAGTRIEWSIQFADDVVMGQGSAELTPSIHSVGGVLLFAHAPRRAMTYQDSVRFDDIEYAHQGPDDDALEGIRSWYNEDYHSAVAIFGVQGFNFDGETLSHSWGGRFNAESGSNSEIWTSELRSAENFVRLIYEDGGLGQYAHFSHGRALTFDIEPALPSLGAITDGARHAFNAGFGAGYAHMSGTIVTHRAGGVVVLEWRPDHPGWALERPFYSLIQRTDDGYILLMTDDATRVFAAED